MQLFSRREITNMVLRYFPSANDFVHFTLDNTYWRRDDTSHAIFISEYEMYGRWIEKTNPDSTVLHRIEKRQIDRHQWSQQETLWDEAEIAKEVEKAEADCVEILKLQSNCPLHDVGWRVKE